MRMYRILGATFIMLSCAQYASAATWCARPDCFVNKNVAVPPSCVVRCDSKPLGSGLVPLGDDELKLTCAIAETEFPFCPSTATQTTQTTQSTQTNQTQQNFDSLLQQTTAQTEQAFQSAYTQFLSDLNTQVTTTNTSSNIQTTTISEISWRDLFRTGVRSSTQVTTANNQQATTPKICTDVFTKNFRLGAVNEEVKLVQKFLNANTDTQIAATGAQSKGKETTSYNALTRDAVNKFQLKYADDVLKPVSEPKPTGFWGPFTRKKANELVCAGTIKIE